MRVAKANNLPLDARLSAAPAVRIRVKFHQVRRRVTIKPWDAMRGVAPFAFHGSTPTLTPPSFIGIPPTSTPSYNPGALYGSLFSWAGRGRIVSRPPEPLGSQRKPRDVEHPRPHN